MQFITYWVYEDLFNEIISEHGFYLPCSYLKEVTVDELGDYILKVIKNFDATNVICFSSFLNMVFQAQDFDESVKDSDKELKHLEIRPRVVKRGILFHRLNLLRLISLCIDNSIGDVVVTNNERNSQNFYKALALINTQLGVIKEDFRLKYLLRDRLHNYDLGNIPAYYSKWLKRYWFIFNSLLGKLPDNKKNKLLEGLNKLEKESGVSLRGYFRLCIKLFHWFINPKVDGFNKANIASFYIKRMNFNEGTMKIFDKLSLDLMGMQKLFKDSLLDSKKEAIDTDPFYQKILVFFKYPVFKIRNDEYCIIDFHFLIEGICSDLVWKIREVYPKGYKEGFGRLKEQYGYLLERYFNWLLEKIFSKKAIDTSKEPDGILKFEKTIIIFEFTTEYYRLDARYTQDSNKFLCELDKILFNNPNEKKRDQGKFIKLDKYVQVQLDQNKNYTVMPVLVTEKYLGDYDLINGVYEKLHLDNKINELKLGSLKATKPLIICLDDLEWIWAFSKGRSITEKFINCINAWNSSDKEKYLFNFSNFINEYFEYEIKNEAYKKFFNIKHLYVK